MVASKRSLSIPLDSKIADDRGQISQPWLDFFILIADAVKTLRTSAEAMDNLSFSTDGFATATDIATAWEELRDSLLDIT